MDLSPFAFGVVGIPWAEESSAGTSRFEQHAIGAAVRRSVGDAMHRQMRVDTRSFIREPFAYDARFDLLQREIPRAGMLSMQQRGGNPDFVSDPDIRSHFSHSIIVFPI